MNFRFVALFIAIYQIKKKKTGLSRLLFCISENDDKIT